MAVYRVVHALVTAMGASEAIEPAGTARSRRFTAEDAAAAVEALETATRELALVDDVSVRQ